MTRTSKGPNVGEVKFFKSGADLRVWLAANHETADELWVGLYRKSTGRPSITWPEVVDEALSYGWIDGIRRGIDDQSYTNRITPRRKGSNWSAVNIRRVAELEAAGRMTDAGRRAFALRDETRTRIETHERETAAFDDDATAAFRANKASWKWFQAAAPSYRKAATYWVTSAKRQDTRDRRLAILIDHSARGRLVPPLTLPSREKGT